MQLKQQLNLLHVICIVSGAMISSGIFILPGLAYAQTGPAVVISYLLAGFIALIGMLSQAELVSAMPKAGGTYFYVTRSMGSTVGIVNGLITWFSLSLKSAFALVGIAAFARFIVNMDVRIIAIVLSITFMLINIVGIKEASRVQVFLVFGILSILLLYIIRGLPAVKVQYFEPFTPRGLTAIFSTSGFVFISYGGLLTVASIAEEVKNPARVIPLGMIISLFGVSIFYFLVVFVTTGVLQASYLANSLTPISDGAAAFMGEGGRIILGVAAILAFVSTANAGIMTAARYPLALSRDGLLPAFLAKINKKFKTPHNSILLTGIFMIVVLFLRLNIFIKAASTVLILTYLFSCLSVIIMRESRLQNYQPSFRAPLYPWLQIAGVISFSVLIFAMGKEALLISFILILGGILVYGSYGKVRTNREYALLHLIERVTAKEFTSHLLETELKEIIRERDDIIKDRFDQVIEKSIVLDIEGSPPVEAFFNLASQALGKKLNVDSDALLKLFLEREKESSTAISSGLAIPHVVIEGEHIFDILLARAREGIFFSEANPKVHAVFVLVGSRDERNFHLRALSAIAQIVQDHNFEKKWLAAKNKEVLRDIVLLGKRRRY